MRRSALLWVFSSGLHPPFGPFRTLSDPKSVSRDRSTGRSSVEQKWKELTILERYEGDVGISIWERIKTCFTNYTSLYQIIPYFAGWISIPNYFGVTIPAFWQADSGVRGAAQIATFFPWLWQGWYLQRWEGFPYLKYLVLWELFQMLIFPSVPRAI